MPGIYGVLAQTGSDVGYNLAVHPVPGILSEGEWGRVGAGQDVGEVDIYSQYTRGERDTPNSREYTITVDNI